MAAAPTVDQHNPMHQPQYQHPARYLGMRLVLNMYVGMYVVGKAAQVDARGVSPTPNDHIFF